MSAGATQRMPHDVLTSTPPEAMPEISSKLPNLVIAGVHKAGTTAVYSYLAKHPEICPSYKKEIDYFLPLLNGGELPPLAEYASHFDHWRGEQFRLEASPSYLYGKEVIAGRIRAARPDARILVILREPVDRLASFFSRAVANSVLPAELSFEEYVTRSIDRQHTPGRDIYARGVREGFYVDYLPDWQRLFGCNLRIVFFDDLRTDPLGLTVGVCGWLGLDAGCYSPQDFTVENRTVHYRSRGLHRLVHEAYMASERFWRRNHALKRRLRALYNRVNANPQSGAPVIDESTLSRLRDLYAPRNEGLKDFLLANGYRSLPGWLR